MPTGNRPGSTIHRTSNSNSATVRTKRARAEHGGGCQEATTSRQTAQNDLDASLYRYGEGEHQLAAGKFVHWSNKQRGRDCC